MGNLGFQELLLILGVFAFLFIIPAIFFLLTLQNTLATVDVLNRHMEPGKVWLLFIPFFNIYWMFIVVGAIADSSKAQLEQYGVYSDSRPTYQLGLGFAICSLCNWIPILGILTGLASFVLFIIYWIQVNTLKNQMQILKQTYSNSEETSIFKQ